MIRYIDIVYIAKTFVIFKTSSWCHNNTKKAMDRINFKFLVTCFVLMLMLPYVSTFAQQQEKHRLIVLSDIEADPDDTQSLIRLLLYSNQIDIRAIIATTSVHQKNNVYPESILAVLKAYQKVQPNLLKHENGFPSADDLMKIVKSGLAVYGMNGVGEGKDSPGSEYIIQILEERNDKPVWVSVWGGANTLAQALFKLKKTKNEADLIKLIAKLRVYTISDQDDSGIWIRNNFPSLFYIVSPGGYGNATWLGINRVIKEINNETISNRWLTDNIQQAHGPLGAMYPDVAYGMEGDTPAWLSLVPNGLNEPEHPEWGGWGGRYQFYVPKLADLDPKGFNGGVPVEPETRPIWTNVSDSFILTMPGTYGRAIRMDTLKFYDNKVTIWRWRDDFQYDFAARMDWTIKSYQDANHPPVPKLKHGDRITVKSGTDFVLDAGESHDPDGDNLSYQWILYPEAGTCLQAGSMVSANNLYRSILRAPVVKKAETLHYILKVTDKGRPALSRYKRVIVEVTP